MTRTEHSTPNASLTSTKGDRVRLKVAHEFPLVYSNAFQQAQVIYIYPSTGWHKLWSDSCTVCIVIQTALLWYHSNLPLCWPCRNDDWLSSQFPQPDLSCIFHHLSFQGHSWSRWVFLTIQKLSFHVWMFLNLFSRELERIYRQAAQVKNWINSCQ